MVDASDDFGELLQRGYRFALSLTHHAARAEDLVQDAWLSVLKARGPRTPEYLFATIRNRFIDQCRRNALLSTQPLASHSDEEREGEVGVWQGDAEIHVQDGSLQRALDRLRPEERAVLFLSAVEDFTAQQIAELLDWPRGTVLSCVHRARIKLRHILQSDLGQGKTK